jgi:hypothetical protein
MKKNTTTQDAPPNRAKVNRRQDGHLTLVFHETAEIPAAQRLAWQEVWDFLLERPAAQRAARAGEARVQGQVCRQASKKGA